jgi:hypothetical protein
MVRAVLRGGGVEVASDDETTAQPGRGDRRRCQAAPCLLYLCLGLGAWRVCGHVAGQQVDVVVGVAPAEREPDLQDAASRDDAFGACRACRGGREGSHVQFFRSPRDDDAASLAVDAGRAVRLHMLVPDRGELRHSPVDLAPPAKLRLRKDGQHVPRDPVVVFL